MTCVDVKILNLKPKKRQWSIWKNVHLLYLKYLQGESQKFKCELKTINSNLIVWWNGGWHFLENSQIVLTLLMQFYIKENSLILLFFSGLTRNYKSWVLWPHFGETTNRGRCTVRCCLFLFQAVALWPVFSKNLLEFVFEIITMFRKKK